MLPRCTVSVIDQDIARRSQLTGSPLADPPYSTSSDHQTRHSASKPLRQEAKCPLGLTSHERANACEGIAGRLRRFIASVPGPAYCLSPLVRLWDIDSRVILPTKPILTLPSLPCSAFELLLVATTAEFRICVLTSMMFERVGISDGP